MPLHSLSREDKFAALSNIAASILMAAAAADIEGDDDDANELREDAAILTLIAADYIGEQSH